MALRQMPNGEYVDIPADITPQGFAKISASYAAKTPPPVAAPNSGLSPRAVADQQQVEEIKGRMPQRNALDTFGANTVHNMTFGLDDVVGPAMLAGTEGVGRAIKNGDVGEVGRTYTNARTASKLARDESSAAHPVTSTIGDVTGILTGPVGAETGVAKLVAKGGQALTKYVPASAKLVERAAQLAEAAKASTAGRMVTKAGGSSVGLGARAGFNQGALTGLTDTGNPEDALNQGVVGGVAGAAASALLRGGQAVYRIAKNQAPEQGGRVAMERIASMLQRSEDAATGKAFTPASVAHEIKATDHGGGNAMVADLMPEAQSWASYLAKQPGSASASHLINTAEERAAGAPDRFDARVRQVLGIDKSAPDAHDSIKSIDAARKAKAAIDYSPDVMDRQLAWNDDLDKFFKKDNPVVRDALTRAEHLIRSEDGDVSQLAFANAGDPANGTMKNVPSMGVLDKIKKGFDSKIGEALRSGDKETARMYSMQLRKLKDAVADANPEYGQALASQRDFFERAQGTELGLSVLNQLRAGKSREVLDQIKASGKPDDLKIGFADALMHLREKGADPVVVMRKFMRSDDQRKVLAHMFGGNKTLNEFERFMRRETRGMTTDKLVSSGRQMQANLLRDPGTGGADEALSDIGKSGMQGGAFGGPLGAVSRIVRQTDMWSKALSPAAKAELAKTLTSKGEGLKKGVARSQAYQRILERRTRRAAVIAGKTPGAVLNGYSEQ